MNEDVIEMIATLHARLNDVEAVVKTAQVDLSSYVSRLDKVDDRIYLLMVDMERASQDESAASQSDGAECASSTESGMSTEGVSDACGSNSSGQNEDQKKELLSDDMKENLRDAGRVLGNIMRDTKEVASEFSGTVGELKDAFDITGKNKRK